MFSNKKLFLLSCSASLIFSGSMYAKDEGLSEGYSPMTPGEISPWFTGPLLAPGVHTVPAGHVDVEPYLNFFAFTGSYNENWGSESTSNFYSLNLQPSAWIGITSFMDVMFGPQIFYQFTQGQRSVQFGDIPFGFDFQLLNENESKWWWPAIRLSLKASGPTGKFQHLDPEKLGTDGVGSGNWQPSATLSIGRIYQTSVGHYLAPRLAFSYIVPNPLHVKNYNVYGGTYGTDGTVYPGNSYWFDFGFEYNMSQSWVLACDLYYQHWNKNRFSGKLGEISPGVSAIMTQPSRDQLSLAPALEYNWSQNVGLIGGVWFTFAGRNASRFITGMLAVNVYI